MPPSRTDQLIDQPGRQAASADDPAEQAAAHPRHLVALLIIGGLIGLAASAVLLVEKIALIADPSYIPSCSINPVLSCGSVMNTPQAEAFGVPNPLIGVAGFAALSTVGATLLAGATFRRWFWLGLQGGVTFGVVFVHWLIFQSLYRIEALCPYCMIVWAVTIPAFWYVTLYNLDRGHLPVPTRARPTIALMKRYHGVILTAWLLAIIALIAQAFWFYWSTLP